MGARTKAGKPSEVKGTLRASSRDDDRYLSLVRECPLRLIRSEPEYERAIAMLDRLSDLGDARTPGETEYLLSLCVFVEKYEDEHEPMPVVSGADMLRYLMETHQMTQSAVASGTGLAVSTVSEILAGKRKIGLKHIERFARFFEVKPSVFLGN